jgi:outer membrane biosynthesis protein TonB
LQFGELLRELCVAHHVRDFLCFEKISVLATGAVWFLSNQANNTLHKKQKKSIPKKKKNEPIPKLKPKKKIQKNPFPIPIPKLKPKPKPKPNRITTNLYFFQRRCDMHPNAVEAEAMILRAVHSVKFLH